MSGSATDTVQAPAIDPGQAMRDRYFALMGVGPLTEEQTARLEERVAIGTSDVVTEKGAKRLATLDKITRKELANQAKQDRANDKSNASLEKERLLYEDRLARSQVTLAALRGYAPASDAMVKAFEGAHAKAADLAQQLRFADADKALHEVHVGAALGDAEKTYEGARKSARAAYPDAFRTLDAIDALLGAPDTPLPRRVLEGIGAECREIERPLLGPAPSDADAADAAKRLKVLHEDLQADIDAATDESRAVRMLRGDALVLHGLLTAPGTGAPALLNARDGAIMRQKIDAAETTAGAHDYQGAREMLQGVIDEATAARDAVAASRLQWEATAAHLPTHLRLVEQLRDSGTAPEIREDAAALAESLREIETLGPGDGLSYTEALDRVQAAAQRRPVLEKQEADFAAFRTGDPASARPGGGQDVGDKSPKPAASPLAAAEARVAARFATIEKLISALHKQVAAATEGHHRTVADGAILERRDQAASAWKARVAKATDAATLDEPGMVATLDEIASGLALILKDPGRLNDAIEGGRLARAQAACAETRHATVEQAEQFLGLDAAKGAAQLARIEAICDEAADAATPKAYRKAMVKLTALGAKGQAGSDEAQTAVAELQAHLQAMLDRIGKELDKLQVLVDGASTGKKQGEQTALLDTMRMSYDTLRAQQKLTQVDALQSAIDDVDAFETELGASIRAAGGKSEKGEGGTITFDQARKAIANIKVTLGEDIVKSYATVSAFDVSEAVTAAEKGFGAVSMTALAASIKELGEKAAAVKQTAKLNKSLCAAFEEGLGPIKGKLDAPAFKDAPAYKKSVQARLKALVGDARFEGGLPEAKRLALALSAELDAALLGPLDAGGRPQALTDHEISAVAATAQAATDQKRFAAQAEILRKRLVELKKLNPREVGPLIDGLDAAKKAAEKSGDFAGGRDQLTAIRKRMGLIAANPGGLAITARNKLPAVAARVQRAVTSFARGTEALEKAVLALPPADLDNAGRAAVSRQLAAVRGLFNPALFEAPIAKITAKDAADTLRTAQREVALRAARQMMTYVNDDFRLQILAETPFIGGMDSAVSELALSLLDLENNLLVSL